MLPYPADSKNNFKILSDNYNTCKKFIKTKGLLISYSRVITVITSLRLIWKVTLFGYLIHLEYLITTFYINP